MDQLSNKPESNIICSTLIRQTLAKHIEAALIFL